MLKADLSSESALGYIIEASYYEDQNLLLDALTKYEQAIKLAPEVQDFQDLYQGFILKYNLGG
jgi:Tfp pilus assembly protein PilF